jgi:nucleoside-diphosphate-sugar epimerase
MQVGAGYHPGGFYNNASIAKPISIWGDGLEVREFLHDADSAEALLKFVEQNAKGIINLVSGRSYSYASIIKYINKLYPGTAILHKVRSQPLVNHTYNPTLINETIGQTNFSTPYATVGRYHDRLKHVY